MLEHGNGPVLMVNRTHTHIAPILPLISITGWKYNLLAFIYLPMESVTVSLSPKQLLVQCATLLCLERREGVATSTSTELVNNILNGLPLPEGTLDLDHGRQTFLELRSTVIWLNNRNSDNFPTETEVLQRIQVACREEQYLYEAILNALMEPYESVDDISRVVKDYRDGLNHHLNEENIMRVMERYFHRLRFQRHQVHDVAEEVREMGEHLQPMVEARQSRNHPAMIGGMDFSDEDTLEQYFDTVKSAVSSEGALNVGWRGLARLLGKVGSFRRGEFITVAALQHNFKSQFLMCQFVHAALFTAPMMRDPTRKPLLYFMSFENEVSDNLLWIYRYLRENESGEPVIDSEVDEAEAARYVSERLRRRGFEVRMDRFDPTEFTSASLISVLDALHADGYEIHGLYLDYLNMISKAGIDAKVAGDDIRLLFRRIRNYTSPRGITCITAHQLSSDALQLTRENVEDFVKIVANKGYYDGCRRLGQEPDLELFLHIVRINGASYLTVQRGKHRNTVTPERDQYLVLPFSDVGTIRWDVDKDHEITLSMPGGGEVGSDMEDPWWA